MTTKRRPDEASFGESPDRCSVDDRSAGETSQAEPCPCFQSSDLEADLPSPGYYRATITSARFRRSARGNDMIQVIYSLEDVGELGAHVAEYFVIGGASPHTLAIARRRLARLYRACGMRPRDGDAIDPADIFGASLEVRVEHDEWRGEARLRVAAHGVLPENRPPGDFAF